MASLTRTLHYSDYRQAHFSFEQALRFPENQEIDLLSYFTADDCIDGDVTPFITLDGDKEVLEGEPKKGIYECSVSVTNSVGYMTTLPISVEIYEDGYDERNQRPQIILNQYIVYMEKGRTAGCKCLSGSYRRGRRNLCSFRNNFICGGDFRERTAEYGK